MGWEGVQPPAEPAGYNPNNKYADPATYFKHREARVAEEYIKVAEAKVRAWALAVQRAGGVQVPVQQAAAANGRLVRSVDSSCASPRHHPRSDLAFCASPLSCPALSL